MHAADDERLTQLAGTDRHQGVVALVDAAMPHVTLDDVLDTLAEPALLLVLDGVTDPHNLGACLRNADAFGAHAVVVPKDRAVGLNATVAKAASGAADTVPVITVTNLARALRDLKAKGVWILGADAGGESLFDGGCHRSGRVGPRGRRRRLATADARTLRPDRRHSAHGHGREPQRRGGERHLPVCIAADPPGRRLSGGSRSSEAPRVVSGSRGLGPAFTPTGPRARSRG